MKRRWIVMLLAAAMLAACLSGVSFARSLCFVAVNDTVPLTIPGETAPYYTGGTLYLPYTAFDANPGGIVVSYNVDQDTFVLFTRNQRLVYNLLDDTVVDENGVEKNVALTYRGGILYIPSTEVSHFGLTATILTSQSGYPILRFTDGQQVYDHQTFVEKAENLIMHMVQQNTSLDETGQSGEGTIEGGNEQTTQIPQEELEPAVVYLAFAGESVSEDTLTLLREHEVRAAFFLTADQFTQQKELVRAIYAAGHTVGLAVDAGLDTQVSLEEANQAMDDVLFCRSVLALVPTHMDDFPYYRIIAENVLFTQVQDVLERKEQNSVLLCRDNASVALNTLRDAGAQFLQLMETTVLSEQP